MSKFEKTYNKIIGEINNKYQIREKIIGGIYPRKNTFYKEESFLQLYKALICEEYTIFPVPRLLMNSMLNYSLDNKSLDEKNYTCKDILENYILDWKYYNQFKENIKLMMKNNINCSITLVLYDTFEDALKIFEKYQNDDVKNDFLNHFKENNKLDEGVAYTYGNDFNVCLAINCSIKDKFILAKIIQHELIHWMQVSLNSETEKTYGKFKMVKFYLDPKDVLFLSNVSKRENSLELVNYLLDEFEFEPWVANTVEEFAISGLSIEEYEKIIKDKNLFLEKTKNISKGQFEMFLFGEVCYIASERKYESYWYYLIEAMKEN